MFKSLISAVSIVLASQAFAGAKTYQVTGPIVEVTDAMITVQKGNEKWQIDRDAATKVTGTLAVGTKVTIEYTMKAATVTAKEDKATDKKPKK
jgi:hypothetical protein